ncbi:MAG: HDIG domain-containing protein [Cyanobacteria bacterium NC_groundwater_1444_Ag_S-0.65um_54_12]|nr:HDIG domain-containing protein [Cyanobacteria bacterium NC_groundwater_1444_Ag_S-0.65um_54_12]
MSSGWLGGLSWAIATILYLFLNSSWFAISPMSWQTIVSEVAVAGLVGGVLLMFAVYLSRYEPEIASSARHLYLLAVVLLGFLAILLLTRTIGIPTAISPIPAVGMLLALFLNWRVAIGGTLAVALPLDLVPWLEPSSLLLGLAGTCVAVYSVRRVRERMDVGRAGIWTGLAMAIGSAITGPLFIYEPRAWMLSALWSAVSGPASAILVSGLLPYLERLTGITTAFTLLELANPGQPLLRQLLLKAPGTYHHSILVGNLGEAAADEIGADPLLVRVGAYYHDIGKTKRPYFFIENQIGIDSQHDNISPRLSSLVITAHVREGIELARQYRLPKPVADFIPMHHGCSLVTYFYQQAVQAEGSQEVSEEHFRYAGPRPNTKETGIVMLADGVEATIRTLTKPVPEQIEANIRRIVNKRIDEGELSNAPLTLQDIERIIQSFNRILHGLYHQRIEYPDQLLEREEKARKEERRRLGGISR